MFAFYDNRIEVESPGLLPGHVTTRNFLKEQFARNGAIVRLNNKFPNPPNKDIGEGLNTAFKAMQMLRLKPPTVEETDNSVVVTIRHAPLSVAGRIGYGLPTESRHDYKPNREGSYRHHVQKQLKEVFYRLNKTGLIERVPGRRGAAAAWQKQRAKESDA